MKWRAPIHSGVPGVVKADKESFPLVGDSKLGLTQEILKY